MTTVQKVIKYLAIAFAIFLIVTIISAILGFIMPCYIFMYLINTGLIGNPVVRM